jgi:hypothetical protein
MIKILSVWILLCVAIGFFITMWREGTGQVRWQLTKTIVFATLCGLVASVLLGFIYILF